MDTGSITRLVTFFLRPEDGHNEHVGSFGATIRTGTSGRNLLDPIDLKTMWGRVDGFVARSSALCSDGVELHVVHNLPTDPAVSTRRGVIYHADPPSGRQGRMPPMPTIDRRFWLLQRLLQGRGASWDCIVAVDLTDVDVLRVPRCSIDLLPRQLLVASDNCGGAVKRWVTRKGADAGFNSTQGDGFRAYLSTPADGKRCICNCGIVGGHRAALMRALRYVVDRLATVWAAGTAGALRLAAHKLRDPVGDMVAWNEYCYEHSVDLITGYPHGPVNLPMYGLHPAGYTPPPPLGCNSSLGANSELCLLKWHTAHVGHYYFGHKLPGWVRWLHLPPTCRIELPAGTLRRQGPREDWRRRGQHRPLRNCTLLHECGRREATSGKGVPIVRSTRGRGSRS